MSTPVQPTDRDCDTTPLLGQVTGRDVLLFDDPNIFLEVVESPWPCVSQGIALSIRLSIAAVMTAIMVWQLTLEVLGGRIKLFFFRPMNISWVSQCAYMWLTAASAPYWTYLTTTSGFQFPWRRLSTPPQSPCGIFSWSTFASPYYSWLTSTFYSFYIGVTLWPLCVTELYLISILPQNFSRSYPTTAPEVLINTLNSLVAIIEVMLLNSVVANTSALSPMFRAPEIAFCAIAYADIWAWLGNAIVNGVLQTDLDWRFLGEDWKDGGVWKTLWLVSNTLCVYTALWFGQVCKGFVTEAVRAKRCQRDVSEE